MRDWESKWRGKRLCLVAEWNGMGSLAQNRALLNCCIKRYRCVRDE